MLLGSRANVTECVKKPTENICFWLYRGIFGQGGYLEASVRHLWLFGPSIAQDGPTIVQYKPRWLKMVQAGPSKTTASGSMALLCHILLTVLVIIIFAFRSIAGQVRTLMLKSVEKHRENDDFVSDRLC